MTHLTCLTHGVFDTWATCYMVVWALRGFVVHCVVLDVGDSWFQRVVVDAVRLGWRCCTTLAFNVTTLMRHLHAPSKSSSYVSRTNFIQTFNAEAQTTASFQMRQPYVRAWRSPWNLVKRIYEVSFTLSFQLFRVFHSQVVYTSHSKCSNMPSNGFLKPSQKLQRFNAWDVDFFLARADVKLPDSTFKHRANEPNSWQCMFLLKV